MIKSGSWHHVVEALRYRDHRLFNATLAPALASIWAQRTAVGWLTWDLTHSPTWLGIIAAADLLPAVFLSPFAGVTADRSVPLHMMRVTQGIIMVHALALWALTVTDLMNIWILFALALVMGLNQPYATAGRMVFYPVLVPKEHLGTAVAINSTVFNGGRALGPALAGVMIGPFGVASVFLLNFVAFIFHMINLYRIRPIRVEGRTTAPKGMLSEIAEGLGYTMRHPGIGPILALLLISTMLSRPITEMLPGFADEVFSRGAQGLGWLLMSMGVGALLGAVWLARRGPIGGLTNIVLIMMMVTGVAMTAFALTDNFWIALALLTLIGFAQVAVGTGTQSLVMTSVAGDVRGRVMSVYAAVHRGTPAIGAIIIGAAAEAVGLGWAVAGAGVICFLSWLFTLQRHKRVGEALEPPPDGENK